MTDIILNEKSPTYRSGFALYQQWCKAKKKKVWAKNPKTIELFLSDLKEGFPSDKPKAVGTLKVKLSAVRNHFELNEQIGKLDFKALQKFAIDLYSK